MKRLLMSGGGGFIGRHALGPLRRHGFEIHLLTHSPGGRKKDLEGVIHHRCDIFDEVRLKAIIKSVRPSHLLHLAWYTVPKDYWTSPENVRWVGATIRLLDLFMDAGGRRAVGAGTCAEYGPSGVPCVEGETLLKPQSLYGVCKLVAGAYWSSTSVSQGVSAAWGRIFHLYGPWEKSGRLVPSLLSSLLNGRSAVVEAGDRVCDFLHVSDVASALVALLDSRVEGPVNIASGLAVRLKDLATRLASRCGGCALLQIKPGVGERRFLRVTADVRRLKKSVGWRPAYNLNQGLDQTIHWWKTEAGICE